MDWAYHEICSIQQAARTGSRILQPQWLLLILRSPKRLTGIKEMDGEPIEGSYSSHQVPAREVKTKPYQLQLLEDWLCSYHVEKLFDSLGHPIAEILELCPQGDRRMGCNPHTLGGRIRKPLNLPNIADYEAAVERVATAQMCQRGENNISNTEQVADYLKGVIEHNPKTFRIFSPDELESNRLTKVFNVTQRNFQWPTQPHDSHISANGGRVLEILSEYTCQAWLQGYLLTGRYGMFPSYEAFLGIITTMMEQYAKFIKFSKDFPWRLPVASLNYLESSTLWRQEHNGFSHQNPGFINSVLDQRAEYARVYLPPDGNCLISTINHCLQSTGYINLVVTNKNSMPHWLSMAEAIAHCRAGASVWPWASIDEGVNPDVVLVGIGDSPIEVLVAAHILRSQMPELRVRVVNVTDLLILEDKTSHPHGLDAEMFNALTAPFDMHVRNRTSRYHLIMQAIELASTQNPRVATRAVSCVHHYKYVLQDHKRFIQENGDDPADITNWQWC